MSRKKITVQESLSRDRQRALDLLWKISALTIYASTPRGIDALRKDFLAWYRQDSMAQIVGIIGSLQAIKRRLAAGDALPWGKGGNDEGKTDPDEHI